MNMTWMSRKFFLDFLVLITLIDITSSYNDTSTESHRNSRVNGRIVKLYSGPKPDPVLCVSDGFLADTVDCSVFYRCLKASNGKYTVYRFQCGPGTVYDPDTEVCNHPRSTKRLECGGLSSNKLISSTEKYNENEIDGINKENHELPSPISTIPPKASHTLSSTTHKPVKLESSYVTSYPWLLASKHESGNSATTSTAYPWNKQPALSTNKPWDFTTRPPHSITRQPSSQRGVQCTTDGFMGDTEDCRKFYRCVNNQRGGYLRYEFSCSESTIWDDDTQGCNHPWAVQRRRCGKGNSYVENDMSYKEQIKNNEITPNDNIPQHQTQFSYGSKVTETQTPINTGPTIQNQTQIIFGDRLNLENFNVIQNQTKIYYGAPISQSSPQLSYANEVKQTQAEIGYSVQPSQTQTQTFDNVLSSTTRATSTSYSNGGRTNKCTKEGFMGDSNDCKKFYRCVSNEKGGFNVYEFSCSQGTLWDDQIEACNHAWAVKKCGVKTSSQNISPITALIESTTNKHYTTTSSSFYNNEVDEVGYVSQNNHHETDRLPSPTATQMTSSTTVTMESSIAYDPIECKSSGFFGNANDCVKFYRCVENGGGSFTKYEYKCGDGTVWDPEIESCNHAWLVKSCGSKKINDTQKENTPNADVTVITTVSLIQTTTQKNIFDQDYDSGYNNINKETSSQSIATTERIQNQGNECKTSGFIGDGDCKKFYRCVENGHGGYTRYEFTCGEGTVWDPNIEACNHAWAVKECGNSSVTQSPMTTLSTTVSQDVSDKDVSYNPTADYNKDPKSTTETTTTMSTTNFVKPVTNKGDQCQSNGFMGNENDCKIFYRCVDNGNGGFLRYEFTCGDGTVWDPKISACNHAWAVQKCGGSDSPHEHISPSTDNPNFTTTSIGSEISTQHSTLSSTSTILTSTVSNANTQCMAEGFIGNEQDCKIFYRCVEDGKGSYTRYEFSCGEGTVWDPKIQACNHAWAVESCKTSNHSTDSIHTSSSHPSTMKDDETSNNPATPNNPEGSTEYNSWSTSTTKSPIKMDDTKNCSSDGFMGDTTDCKKFYRCVNDGKGSFIRYEFSCGEGTIWDSEINACNHPYSVKTPCSSINNETIKENEPNLQSTSTVISDYSTTSKQPPRSQECEREGFFGDKTGCKKFYRCVDDGKEGFHKYEFTCGEGTVWDQEILACNHATSNSHCVSTDKESQTGSSDISSTTTPAGISQSTEKTQTSISGDCTSEGFYANSNDCKKFFRCVGDGKGAFIRYDFTCGEGTIWVQDIQACDHDSDTSVCSKGSITISTTTDPSHTSQEKPITTISSQSSGSTTTIRSTSESSTKPTMQDETVSESSSTSESSSPTSTSASTGNQDLCQEAGYYGNSQDCTMFYRCVDNGKGGFTKYDFTCGEGTIWDQDITTCNHPQDVSNPSCENKGSTSTTTTTTTTSKTTAASNETTKPTKSTSTTESTTSQSSNQSTEDSTTKKPSNNNYTCTEAGFFADPYDCKKFYRCVDWGGDGKTFSIYHFDCGEGTIWDPNLQTCNHEESVYPPRDCSGTQSQNETTTAKQDETTESSTEGSTTITQSTTQKSTTTTKQSSTTEETSTQQSSTSEQTSSTQQSSTQQSTTEQSTTQKSTTKEPNTTQQSTTEQSTTQQSTTEQSTTASEQTTTQKSTTEQSTTQQSTTASEQTTTQQSTTEQSTTQQSTTASEQTTTQQSSTTQQSTTPDQTTTTTTEPTTTITNQESTTTATQTTTSETTDQTTKAEQSTTQEPTEQTSENQSTTEQSTTQETTDGSTTTESGQDSTTEQGTANKECPETDDDQYLFVCPTGFKRHPKYCNLFYQCTEDDDSHEMKVAVFNCPNNTIYDESKTQCVEEDKADKKCDGQIAQKRRVKRLDAHYKETIAVGRDKYLCPTAGHFPFEKNEQCSPVLFKCEVSKTGKLRGFIYQCPEGYVYWAISRRCEPVNSMTDCKHQLTNWTGRYEIPIERNNVARKSIK